jgi:hypothetical protein
MSRFLDGTDRLEVFVKLNVSQVPLLIFRQPLHCVLVRQTSLQVYILTLVITELDSDRCCGEVPFGVACHQVSIGFTLTETADPNSHISEHSVLLGKSEHTHAGR